MHKYKSILVEDEAAAAEETTEALEAAGFEVIVFRDAVSALSRPADTTGDLIDLLVLDRRLPKRFGEVPTDDTGDELLAAMLQTYPDLTTIVFSGHTGFEHLQFATTERGIVSMQGGAELLDRVRLFEKSQSIEFDRYLERIHSILSRLDDIQIRCDDLDHMTAHDKRLLRRVAFELGGSSIDARALTGGLTDSPVWLCLIRGEDCPTARIVAKRQIHKSEPGGFQALCPAQLTAGTISVVSGFCGGYHVTIQQLVEEDPVSLMDLLVRDPAKAAEIVFTLKSGLDSIHSGQEVNATISAITSPFENWDTVRQRAADFDIEVAPGSRIATTVRSPQHGDLHPGNVLVAGGHPVIIDFDSQTTGSELIDVVALLLGPVFHRDSPIRSGEWPSAAQCDDLFGVTFLDGCPAPVYFQTVIAWMLERRRSLREMQALILAFTVRQLRYPDVVTNETVRSRAIRIAQWASQRLDEQ